jgi:hypothetical protein
MDACLDGADLGSQRARIVLLAADGVANTRIAELVDSTVTTVLSWRDRYQSKGLAAWRMLFARAGLGSSITVRSWPRH